MQGREPAGISLAAEVISMSADDWAAFLRAADAGRLLCPLLDCFALSSSSEALLSQVRQSEDRSITSLSVCDAVTLIFSLLPSFLPAGLSIFTILQFSHTYGCP